MPQLFVIVLKQLGKPDADREQSSCLRRKIEPSRIGTSNDEGDFAKRRIVEVMLRQECVETAQRPLMAQFHPFDIEWRRPSCSATRRT